mmetsp:Transcript_135191/g.263302  ORF Transcript_135191/g.263302 Transcript_135191/m.263302 type:complete len:252 (+) Transcript_135191:58-813(+)
MAEGVRPPSSMKLVSTAERQLARQLSEERDERNKAVSALWARLEELNKQIQRLEAQPQPTQLAPPPLLPAMAQDSLLTSRGLDSATHVASGVEANGQVEERVQALMDQINESRVKFTERPPELTCTTESAVAAAGSGTGGSLDGPLGTTADAIAALQHIVKDLNAKQRQQAKEVSYLRGGFIEVHIRVQMNAIRASKIALKSTTLSTHERNEALVALDRKETECKSCIRKICSGPQLADLMSALATEAPPV